MTARPLGTWMGRLPRLALLAAGAALCAGCPGEAPPPAPQAKGPAVAPRAAQAQTAAAAPEDYHYDPTDKSDPFRSFIKVSQKMLDQQGVASPLERFDLSQLTVTAIIWGTDQPRALIQDPAGKGYIVAAGTLIGKNKGRIISIEDNRVVVKETYVDFHDRATTKEVEMRLHENQGG